MEITNSYFRAYNGNTFVCRIQPQEMCISLLDEKVCLTKVFKRCYVPQGHRRKNWKVRKFILRDDPAYMHYYDPTKVIIDFLKQKKIE